MGWFGKSESDRNLRAASETIQEDRQARRNDTRRDRGQGPQHCGVDAVLNSNGDYDCAGGCGAVGIA